jgi:hypothetical protein
VKVLFADGLAGLVGRTSVCQPALSRLSAALKRGIVVGRFLFYYSVASSEIRLTAIIPAAMRRA